MEMTRLTEAYLTRYVLPDQSTFIHDEWQRRLQYKSRGCVTNCPKKNQCHRHRDYLRLYHPLMNCEGWQCITIQAWYWLVMSLKSRITVDSFDSLLPTANASFANPYVLGAASGI